jgi:hypothetical protein
MKVLFATSPLNAGPYIPDMIEEFERRDARVDLFDLDDLGGIAFAPRGS